MWLRGGGKMRSRGNQGGKGLKACKEERAECQIFDFAQLLNALLVSVDEILICILQLKVIYMPLKVLKTKI